MKKHLLFGSLIFTGFAFSQITVTEYNLVQPSDVVEQAFDQSNSITHAAAGTDLSWNYVALLEDSVGGFSVGAASWGNGSSNFPTANLYSDDNSGQGHIYLRKTASAFDVLGLYGDPVMTGNNEAFAFDPQNRITPLPLTYNTTDQNDYIFDFTFDPGQTGVDSVRVKQEVEQDFLADAWGELTSPLGTYEVVRLLNTQITTDSTWAYSFGSEQLFDSGKDTTYSYSFFTNDPNVRYPVVEYDYDPNAQQIVGDITWLKALPTTSLEEVNLSSFSVYPNPASNEVVLFSEDINADYLILDITGKKVLSGNTNAKETTVDISNLKQGVYLVKFFNNEKYIGTKKLIKK
jgi:hypothetical protein